jgi:hypothetical protein
MALPHFQTIAFHGQELRGTSIRCIRHPQAIRWPDTDDSVCNRRNTGIYCIRIMKLDDWLARLVAVPPGRSPLANGLAIGMRIALFILIPLGIIATIAIVLLHR